MVILRRVHSKSKHISRIVRWKSCRTALEWPHKNFEISDLKYVEERWSNEVKCTDAPGTSGDGRKYILSMFPYPSGALHMGHVRVYTIADCIARFERLNGNKVFQPIGWDAFGLPAENAAREKAMDPKIWTQKNIAEMRLQLEKLGCQFDWSAELSTCDTSYYRWTQSLFLLLYNSGLVKRQLSLVNWDPVDKTVLANEQIDENGRSWRSGAVVEKKSLKQWLIRTPYFAEALYKELDNLSNCDEIVAIQKDWIGKCDGYAFHLPLETPENSDSLHVFVRDLDIWKEPTFLVINKNHILAAPYLNDFNEGTHKRLDFDVLHPACNVLLPVFLTAEEDDRFIHHVRIARPLKDAKDKEILTESNMNIEDLPKEFSADTGDIIEKSQQLKRGGYKCSEKSQDWVVSRQRFWGTPIPIIHCENCGEVPVAGADLPVVLPEFNELHEKDEQSTSPLHSCKQWRNTICPNCASPALRECDTLDTFFDSSWYFLRYLDSKNEGQIFNGETVDKWMPVDLYVGGKEHAVLHLYFARFIMHFLHEQGLVKHKEPFKQLLPQGMIKGKTYTVEETGRYVKGEDVTQKDSEYFDRNTNEKLVVGWEKMSKSKYNGVNPMDMIDKFGTDLVRIITIAGGSPRQEKNWDTDVARGIIKWIGRMWSITNIYIEQIHLHQGNCSEVSLNESYEYELSSAYNDAVRSITHYIRRVQLLNAAFKRLQELAKVIKRFDSTKMCSHEFERTLKALITMTLPFAPHVAMELWQAVRNAELKYNQTEFIDKMQWPVVDSDCDLDLEFQYDTKVLTKIKLNRDEIREMTVPKALEYADATLKLKKLLKKRKIRGGKLEFIDDFGVRFDMIVED